RFTPKNEPLKPDAHFSIREQALSCTSDIPAVSSYIIENNGLNLLTATDGTISVFEPVVYGPFMWSLDTRDGRNDTGIGIANHRIIRCTSDFHSEVTVLYSLEPVEKISKKAACGLTKAFDQAVQAEEARINALTDASPLKSPLGVQLTISADAFIVDRESTGGKTIIAGYPFFEDWGRDTMIALGGTTLATGRFSECKSILRTFAKYEKNGLLPNLFPEGGMTPMYNSADAPLLFINAVYEYIKFSNDEEFLQECFAPMKEIMDAYENGTDFHIKCDSDGLIMAGDGLEQLTWMDVRVGDYLPTPRHGKPVEINAYWYSALCCMQEFCLKKASVSEASADIGNTGETAEYYTALADKYAAMSERTRESFLAQYPDSSLGCLKDVLNETYEENQIRCNQIWALTQPFTMLNNTLREEILDTVERELYTTAGLRTLSMKDENFHAVYIGDMINRDRAYHQGTVWTFPLGAFLRAKIMQLPHYNDARRQAECQKLEHAFEALKGWLFEGCLGQLAEIYDGKEPTVSRGCYAQAWSVGEILRAVYDWENYQTRRE
ncbi:MAG: amylo-alpha-1,6-glucosidase, partial [Lachnospiraceae bacterium]